MADIDRQILIERLMLLGLTRQEATIYLHLFKNHELTGYEAAKSTGISRSNVYSSLASLVDKGAAYIAEGTATKYIPVPIDELCENRIRLLQETKDYLSLNMPRITDTDVGYITIEGYRNISDKVKNMLMAAQYRVYLAVSGDKLQTLQYELKLLTKRKIKVVLLTDRQTVVGKMMPEKEMSDKTSTDKTAYNEEILDREILDQATVYFTTRRDEQIHLITDSKYVLTGDMTGKDTDTCLYSGQVNFVNVLKDALRNEIKINELTGGK